MRKSALIGALVFIFAVTASPQAQQPKRKKLLAIGLSAGFQHDSVSHGLATIWKIGQQSGLWDTFIRTDTQLLTKKKLGSNGKNIDYFDALMFYTTGELPMDDEQKAALMSFVKDDGKGFLGTHSATDTFYKWPEYGEMIGGDYSRDRVRVLMSVDANSVDLTKKNVHRTDKDFAVTWVRNFGKGRVFYSSLGHEEQVWDRPDIQQMWLEAVKWAMGMTQGEAAPRPKPAD